MFAKTTDTHILNILGVSAKPKPVVAARVVASTKAHPKCKESTHQPSNKKKGEKG